MYPSQMRISPRQEALLVLLHTLCAAFVLFALAFAAFAETFPQVFIILVLLGVLCVYAALMRFVIS